MVSANNWAVYKLAQQAIGTTNQGESAQKQTKLTHQQYASVVCREGFTLFEGEQGVCEKKQLNVKKKQILG